ncbi:UBA-like protein [Tanacetum coccineum]
MSSSVTYDSFGHFKMAEEPFRNEITTLASLVVTGVVELFMSQIPQLSLTKYYYDNLDLEGPVEEGADAYIYGLLSVAICADCSFTHKLEVAMSLASKSKSKDKRVAGNEPKKSSTKPHINYEHSGYLMSRKLEGLAQQLVAMRFSYERATMAIILNEGKVEQSVAWLFEGVQISEGTCNHDATAKIKAHTYDFSSSSSAFVADWNPSVVEQEQQQPHLQHQYASSSAMLDHHFSQ